MPRDLAAISAGFGSSLDAARALHKPGRRALSWAGLNLLKRRRAG